MADTSALLVGCARCDPIRVIRGEARDKRVDKKGGIRRSFTKGWRGRLISQGAWVEGDLDNMENLMVRKNINVFSRMDYHERKENGRYAQGKLDVLNEIRNFFDQDNVAHFILYFTGNGDLDGSWVIPVTTRVTEHPKAVGRSEREDDVYRDSRTVAPIEREDEVYHTCEDQDASVEALAHEDCPIVPLTTTSVLSDSMINTYSASRAWQERPPPIEQWNDLVNYEDVIELWDEGKRGRERYLMMILDCCHSGRWVMKVDRESEPDNVEEDHSSHDMSRARRDVCVQASCRPTETCSVTENQLGSVFTTAFVAAQYRSTFEKFVLSLVDHIFVVNVVSMGCSRGRDSFTPMSSKCGPFAGIKFFDSFDDMYLQT